MHEHLYQTSEDSKHGGGHAQTSRCPTYFSHCDGLLYAQQCGLSASHGHRHVAFPRDEHLHVREHHTHLALARNVYQELFHDHLAFRGHLSSLDGLRITFLSDRQQNVHNHQDMDLDHNHHSMAASNDHHSKVLGLDDSLRHNHDNHKEHVEHRELVDTFDKDYEA